MFTEEQHPLPVSKHPIGAHTMKFSTQPSIGVEYEALRPWIIPPEAPKTVAEYINSNLPQVGVHVLGFTDSTIISISWPHTFSDLLGLKEMLSAWTRIMSDPSAQVREPYHIREAPLEALGRDPKETYRLSVLRMSNWAGTGFLIRRFPEYLLHKRISRTVFLPADFISSLRDRAYSSLDHLAGKTAFISEGDVIFAWWARLVLQSYGVRNKKTHLITVASRREIFSRNYLHPDRVYLSNAIGFIPTFINGSDLLDRPIGWTAARIRDSLRDLHQKEQIEAYEAEPRTFSLRLPVALGDSTMRVISSTNWTKANLYDLEFAASWATATKAPTGESVTTVGDSRSESFIKPTKVQGYIEDGMYQVLGPLFLIIKDKNGNYEISGYARKRLWSRILSQLSNL